MFILFAGCSFYAAGGANDYKGTFITKQGAINQGVVRLQSGDDWWHVTEGKTLEVVARSEPAPHGAEELHTDKIVIASKVAAGQFWRHHWSGRTYEVLHTATVEASDEPAVVYRQAKCPDGPVWVRPLAEFTDGRFERVAISTDPAAS